MFQKKTQVSMQLPNTRVDTNILGTKLRLFFSVIKQPTQVDKDLQKAGTFKRSKPAPPQLTRQYQSI